MAAGVPVVATQIAVISELVEDGISGYLVPPGDSNILTIRIAELLKDCELRTKFGTAGRAKVEKDFNIQHEAARLYKLMNSALQNNDESIRPDYDEKQVHLTKSETIITSR